MEDFVKKLAKPRAAWVMVPAGDATESTVMKLASLMEPGDTIIDGGNSYFKDDVRRVENPEGPRDYTIWMSAPAAAYGASSAATA